MKKNFYSVAQISQSSVLRKDNDFKKLADAYRLVFGSAEKNESGNIVWGEGYICKLCKKVYPLEESNNRTCACGGSLVSFYTEKSIRKRLLHESSVDKNQKGFCFVLKYNRKVVGFIWGAILASDKVAKRISQNAFNGKYLKEIREILSSNNLILYFDELGILKNYRGGVYPLFLLFHQTFKFLKKDSFKKIVFWTSDRSPIFKLAKKFGFQEIGEFEDICILESGRARLISFLLTSRPLFAKIFLMVSNFKGS